MILSRPPRGGFFAPSPRRRAAADTLPRGEGVTAQAVTGEERRNVEAWEDAQITAKS